MIIEEMDSTMEKEAEYKALIQQASTNYLNKHYNTSLSKYNDALVLASDIKASEMTKAILKYMICLCLLQSNKLQDLIDIIIMIQSLDKTVKSRFPELYILLAKAHCKLYRFDHALNAIDEGTAIYNSNRLLETFYIPGTHVEINLSDKKTWSSIRDDCLSWHKPDATCNLENCCNTMPPYTTTNKNIFLNDPAFNGMVVVHCNNKKRSCSLKFHQCCWKFKKDQMYPIEKMSDKDVLGNNCFTPNCQNDNVPCIVSAIEVVGQNGEVKAHVKESTSVPWPMHKVGASKGAIKKTKLATPKKVEYPSEVDMNSITVRKDIFVDKPTSHNGYEDDQIIAVKDDEVDLDFSSEPQHIAGEKNFLFSLFHDYIQSNLVRVGDVYTKFSEIREDLHLKNLDIMKFLIQTHKFEVLSKKSDQDSFSPRNKESFQTSVKTERVDNTNLNKTIDIDDMYNELMNDEECFEMTNDFPAENQNSCNENENYSLQSNGVNTNFTYDQAAGHNLQSNNCTTYNFPHELHSQESQKKISENRKLKEYIEQCTVDMNKTLHKVSLLENQLKTKDAQIIKLMKEQEDYSMEVDKLCENMKVFQMRHDEIKEENLRIKHEMINVLRDKKVLEEKLLGLENCDTTKQEFLKVFQEEYKILEERINEEWQERIDKLQKNLEEQMAIKKSLLNKCLHYQHTANRNALQSYIDECTITLDVICKINIWMESALSIKNFVEKNEWLNRLNFLKNVLANCQKDYATILEKLISDEIKDDISISLPHIPNPPAVNLGELVQDALNTFFKGQCQVMQNALKMQQQSIGYQMPPMHVNNVPYNQFSQQYPYGPAYPLPRQPIVTNSLLGHPPVMNLHQMQRMGMPPPPLMSQNIMPSAPIVPKFDEVLLRPITKNNCTDLSDINSVSNSTNSKGIASKIENLTIQMAELNVEMNQEKKEEVQQNEKIIIEKEETVKQSIDEISIRNEKMAKMKEACKAIALKIQQKKLDDTNDERFDNTSNKHLSNGNSIDEEGSNIDNDENVETTSSLELACANTFDNSTVNSSEENTQKQRKKIGIDGLIKLMKQKYPETLEVEIIEIICNIRRKHNNSLSRVPVNQILNESDEYIKQKHNLHTLRYNKTDGNKTNQNETSTKPSGSNQNGKKSEISPASSCNSLSKLEGSPAQKKKTWNKITPYEVQWTSSGEVECSICMSVVSNKATSYTLNCRHSFHKQCVKSWLKSDRSCPNCRVAVTEDDEFPPLPV